MSSTTPRQADTRQAGPRRAADQSTDARLMDAPGPEAGDAAGNRNEDLLPGGPSSGLASLSYEQARAALAEVVSALEAPTVSLEESLALWERGNRLADIAQAHLDGARDRIASLRPDLLADNP